MGPSTPSLTLVLADSGRDTQRLQGPEPSRGVGLRRAPLCQHVAGLPQETCCPGRGRREGVPGALLSWNPSDCPALPARSLAQSMGLAGKDSKLGQNGKCSTQEHTARGEVYAPRTGLFHAGGTLVQEKQHNSCLNHGKWPQPGPELETTAFEHALFRLRACRLPELVCPGTVGTGYKVGKHPGVCQVPAQHG